MQELEQIKAKRVTVPKKANRYAVAYYSKMYGWQIDSGLFTTPESALENFIRCMNNYKRTGDSEVSYYQVFELALDIPFITAAS